MKRLAIIIVLSLLCWNIEAQTSFSELKSPTMFVGKTKNGVKLEYRAQEEMKFYRMTFPVYEPDKAQGEAHMEFKASDAELESLRVHMIKSMTGAFDRTNYEIGIYQMEIFTNRKTVYGKEKQLGKTTVTILRPDDGSETDQLKYDGKIQEGYFTITETEVNRLFGKLKF